VALRKVFGCVFGKGLGIKTPRCLQQVDLPKCRCRISPPASLYCDCDIAVNQLQNDLWAARVLADVIFLEFATTQYPSSRSRSADSAANASLSASDDCDFCSNW